MSVIGQPASDRAWLRVANERATQHRRYGNRADSAATRWNRELVRNMGDYASMCLVAGESTAREVATMAGTAVCALEALTAASPDAIRERIFAERLRQDTKFAYPRPHTWDEWLLVLTEEQGEFAEALNDNRGVADAKPASFNADAERELIQVAAVGVCILTHYEDGRIPCGR